MRDVEKLPLHVRRISASPNPSCIPARQTLSKSKLFTHQPSRPTDEMFATLGRQRGLELGPVSSSSTGRTTSPRNLFEGPRREEALTGVAGGAATIGGDMVTISQQCRKRKKRPDRGSNPGLPHHVQDALPLSYPASLWRNHQLQHNPLIPTPTAIGIV